MILTAAQKDTLARLYDEGAWTGDELYAALTPGEVHGFLETGVLMSLGTDMGHMTLLGPAGRKAVIPDSKRGISTTRQIDYAYVRLCARDLGWSEPDFAVTPDYRDLARDTFHQVDTPTGPALVIGKLSRGGYTSTGIESATERLRAPALYHRFKVIVLTPSRRRGRAREARNAAFLKVIHHLPNIPREGPGPSRIQQVTALPPAEVDPGAAITARTAEQLRQRGVPDLTLQILQMTRARRVEQVMADLEVDEVISAGQLASAYALDPTDLTGINYVDEIVRPVYWQGSREFYHRFYCAGRDAAKMDVNGLMHRVGTGALRRAEGAPADPNTYQLERRNRHRSEEPDALWHSPGGAVALEYDSGTYSATAVALKVQKFRERGADRIVWGLPAPGPRVRRLEKKHALNVRICPWWETE